MSKPNRATQAVIDAHGCSHCAKARGQGCTDPNGTPLTRNVHPARMLCPICGKRYVERSGNGYRHENAGWCRLPPDRPAPDAEEKAREEVERLQAGPQLDWKIWLEVIHPNADSERIQELGWVPPRYSTEMYYAWTIVEKLRRDGINLWALGETAHEGSPPWQADFGRNHESDKFAFADTPELAICRAALLWAPELPRTR